MYSQLTLRSLKLSISNFRRNVPDMQVCLVVAARDAEHQLVDWLQYHAAHGIDRFYIADHRPSQDRTSEILENPPELPRGSRIVHVSRHE